MNRKECFKEMQSIRVRLTVFFSLICVGCLLVSMLVTGITTKNRLTQSNDDLHGTQVEYYAAMVESWLQESTHDVDAACTYLEAQKTIDDALVRAVMEQFTKNNPNASDINVGFENKSLLMERDGILMQAGIASADPGIPMPKQQGERNISETLMLML